MIDWLVGFALRKRLVVAASFGGSAALGIIVVLLVALHKPAPDPHKVVAPPPAKEAVTKINPPPVTPTKKAPARSTSPAKCGQPRSNAGARS